MSAPAHGEPRAWPDGYGTSGGCLTVGGRPVTDWAAELGTPLFLYDSALIAARVRSLRAAMPAEVHLHYAIKANPLPAVVNLLAGLTDGLDVASVGELGVALASGVQPERISFAGPAKRDPELAAAIQAGIILNIEGAGELERAARIATALGLPLKAALRINPDFEVKGSGMRMGGGAKPFGVDTDQAPALLARMAALGVDFHGFHIFAGSQNLSADAIAEAQALSLALAARLAAHAPRPPRHVNIGGGLGVPYTPQDKPLDLARLGESLHARLARKEPALVQAAIVLELGRYLVAEAGVYLTRVVEKKQSRGETFLITDGGLHHQLAASGNFGQAIRRNYPVAIANKYTQPAAGTASVVGCLCTPLDKLGEKIPVPDADAGDIVAVFLAGAYGATASPGRFLSHPEPAERLV